MSLEQTSLKEYDLAQTRVDDLFLSHSDFLMRVFLKNLPRQDALDLFQGLYVNIAQTGIPDGIENVKSYLYRAAINDIIDFKRKASAHRKKVQRYAKHAHNPLISDDPAEIVMRFNLLMNAFEKIEKKLDPSFNQVFVHKYQYNLNNSEIADKLNIKKETIDRYLSVGTKQIQELYDQLLGDPDAPT